MGIQSFSQVYSAMSAEDKAALKQLKLEEEKRVGRELSIREVLEAVTPGFADPAYLKG
jgi:hypothetical protein